MTHVLETEKKKGGGEKRKREKKPYVLALVVLCLSVPCSMEPEVWSWKCQFPGIIIWANASFRGRSPDLPPVSMHAATESRHNGWLVHRCLSLSVPGLEPLRARATKLPPAATPWSHSNIVQLTIICQAMRGSAAPLGHVGFILQEQTSGGGSEFVSKRPCV